MSDTPPIKPAAPTLSAEVKPHTLDYSLTESKWSRFTRHLPSGEQLLSFLRTLVWVAPLTLLIWIYAEREQTVTVPSAPFPIEVKTTAANHIVTLTYPQDGMLVPEFSGPRAKIDRVKELLVPKAEGAAVQLFIDPQFGPNTHDLLTVSQLNNHPLFKNNGITVKSCQPPFLKVRVDVMKDDELKVVATPEIRRLLKEDPVFSPPTVRVRGPSQHFEDAMYNSKYYLEAQIPAEQLKNKTGPVTLESVPIKWFYKDHVLFATQTVKATLSLKQSDVEYKIPSLSVRQELPPGLDDVKVDYPGTIANVTVIGPPDQIERIKKEPDKYVIPRIQIDSLAKPDERKEAALKFEMPPGVVLSQETQDRANKWFYTLVKR
jgi:hypothetical protein